MLGEALVDDMDVVQSMMFGEERLDDVLPKETTQPYWEWRREYLVTVTDMSVDSEIPEGEDPWLIGNWNAGGHWDERPHRMNPWFIEFPAREARHWCHQLCLLRQRALAFLDEFDPTGELCAKYRPATGKHFATRRALITSCLAARQARRPAPRLEPT